MRKAPRLFLAALLATSVVAAGCGGDDDSGSSSEAGVVLVKDNKFEPKNVTVSVGDTVTWKFEGASAHNVAFSNDDHSDLMKDGEYDKTFDEAGEYKYTCTVHAGMAGSVEVEESASQAP